MPFGMSGTRVWGIAIPIKFAREDFPVFGKMYSTGDTCSAESRVLRLDENIPSIH